ncbi:Craniofacial development protein 2 [Varanus komodoensis]|nr:Craniofacial development protein 2 [Varanus komodoensis]
MGDQLEISCNFLELHDKRKEWSMQGNPLDPDKFETTSVDTVQFCTAQKGPPSSSTALTLRNVYKELQPEFSPKISHISNDIVVNEGNNVTLACLATGKPDPSISWRHLSPSVFYIYETIGTFVALYDSCLIGNKSHFVELMITWDLLLRLAYTSPLLERDDSTHGHDPDAQHRNQIDYVLCSQRWRSSVQSVKTRPGADCGSDHELLVAKFILQLKKVGKSTRPLRYDLNHIPDEYTVEVTNRFKELDLIDRVSEELWMEVHNVVQEEATKTIPQKKKCKKAK